jgi:large subunit ribosomal protein L12e
VTVLPAASSLLIRALNEGPRDRKKTKNVLHNGNLKLENVIAIAKQLRHKSMASTFTGTVKEIIGTGVPLGLTIDGKTCREVQKLIDDGEIEINE